MAFPDPLFPDYTLAPLQDWEQGFADFEFRTLPVGEHVLPYRIHRPADLEPGRQYPLVVLMHGAGERGADNRRQLLHFLGDKFWDRHPCFIIAPQCPAPDETMDYRWVDTNFSGAAHPMAAEPNWQLRGAMDLVDQTMAENPIDPRRIYLSGLSMGAFATWEILSRQGDKFAAAVPVCGGADLAQAPRLTEIPLWVFHGEADDVVFAHRSRDIVAAIQAAGGTPKYTEYPGLNHASWAPTYANPAVWDWLFAQRKP